MNWIDILLGALSGGALVSLLTLPSIIKKAKAEARAAEMDNMQKVADGWEKIADERQEENAALNAKIDSLYVEIRNQRDENNRLTQENTRLQVKIASDEVKLCYVRGCDKREPQSGY